MKDFGIELTLYTVLYIPLFFVLLLWSLVSFDGNSVWKSLLLPVSIPLSIYWMWKSYFQGRTKKARILAGIPLYAWALLEIWKNCISV